MSSAIFVALGYRIWPPAAAPEGSGSFTDRVSYLPVPCGCLGWPQASEMTLRAYVLAPESLPHCLEVISGSLYEGFLLFCCCCFPPVFIKSRRLTASLRAPFFGAEGWKEQCFAPSHAPDPRRSGASCVPTGGAWLQPSAWAWAGAEG